MILAVVSAVVVSSPMANASPVVIGVHEDSLITFTPSARDEPGPDIGFNNLVVELPAGASNGTQVRMAQPTGADNQNWVIGLDHEIFNPTTSKCLDIQTLDELGNVVVNPHDGTIVTVNDCNHFNTQTWTLGDNVINGTAPGGVTGNIFFSGSENICLAVVDPTNEIGSLLEVTDCTGGADQDWRIPFATV
ncbi:RICIN domain-containing protein [Rhodococcus marinonascens]|uniref:RICIN domain-containing protein n=1 Tax=Rhodococcus marinonascens TaxID=38311 RepID=UPI000934CC75|nr:ricin-type beta-trefoil lectin domain protein [Rhodococcus marinonascens]